MIAARFDAGYVFSDLDDADFLSERRPIRGWKKSTLTEQW